jgi:IclR family acetate operon transcriptional repressor
MEITVRRSADMPAHTGGEKKETARSGTVQSVERALTLLELLGTAPEGYRLTDLAVLSALSPSTVHRLLTTLEERRFVQFDPSDGMWHVGRQAFAVGAAFVRQRNFVAPALPFLRRLRDLTRETANLGVVENGEMMLLTRVESREITRSITQVGGRVPIFASGMGKAILSTYASRDVDALAARFAMKRQAPASLARAPDLSEQLETARKAGYAIDDEEFVTGVRCVAAVVYGNGGEALCAISVSGLQARMTRERIPQLGRLVAETAADLTRALAG